MVRAATKVTGPAAEASGKYCKTATLHDRATSALTRIQPGSAKPKPVSSGSTATDAV